MINLLRLPVALVWLLASVPVIAKDAFQIPRSEVIELEDLSSKRTYPAFIKLPKSYQSDADKHYPVIYLTDGAYSFQIASGVTRFPMNSGQMDEAILVALSYSKGSKGAESRIRDYTPFKAADWKRETGDAKRHAEFIKNVLIPYVEGNYRTNPNRRTFVGNSLGGLFGAYILFSQPELFSSYVLGSPSVWFNKNQILSSKAEKPDVPVKVYLSVGSRETPEFGLNNDMIKGAGRLTDKIKSELGNKVSLQFRVIEGATHATAFPTTLIQGLDWIYGIPQTN
ncbi:alpha/beta hydrolase [Shewanella submarina]|uniref:Alpha/beta hydrolase n=1 Tax=Shewanella submarina TaxID=2016376 RepID=A0ABV7GI61_9GAMM|nr:alpha/beta hydrolase-fold protein [Shewanella submarina]MCL1038105.1 alpha/beta hydrolase [Shewanella submarina]